MVGFQPYTIFYYEVFVILCFLNTPCVGSLGEWERSQRHPKIGNMVRRKPRKKEVTVREKRFIFLKCLRDLRDQIFGNFKSLETLLIIYAIYRGKKTQIIKAWHWLCRTKNKPYLLRLSLLCIS